MDCRAFLKASVATGITLAAAATLPAMAMAQSEPDRTEQAFADIIVTASKRAENVQDVPLAISVITSQALERSNIREFTDLTKLAPSLTISKTTQPANNSIILRGIGTYAFSIAAEPSVSVVVDDVPLAFQAQAFTDLIDLERVEVLRGPQSTLYGKNASAGLISVITQAPTEEFSARAQFLVTDDDEQRGAITIAGPISKTLGFRLTGSASRYDGNVSNLTTGNKLNGRKDYSVRGRLRWQPDENTDINLIGHYNRVDTNCCVGALISITDPSNFYNRPQFPLSVSLEGITPGKANTKVRNDIEARGDSRDWGGSAKVDYSLGDYTLTSITAYQRYKLYDDQDVDGSDLDISSTNTPPAPNGYKGGFRAYGEFNVKSFTQEFRVTSPSDAPVRYLLGAFYADNDFDRDFVREPVPLYQGSYFTTSGSRSKSLFGQMSMDVLPRVTVIGGIRFNSESIRYTYLNRLTGAFFKDSHDDDAVTGRVGAEYHPTDDIMLFATYATGYKGQAYDLTSSFNAAIAAIQPVKPELSKNYEAGFKSSLFDRRVIFNVTAFNTDFTNFQAQSREPSIAGSFVLSNVGKVRTRGVEADLAGRFDTFSFSAGMAYVDAKIRDFPIAQCYPQQTAAQGCLPAAGGGSAQDLGGKRLNNAPEWKFNVSATQVVPLDALPFDAFIQGTQSYQSKVNFTLTQDPDAVQKGYGITDLAIGIQAKDSRYKVTAFVNNLFNTHYALNRQDQSNYYFMGGQPGNAVVRTPARDFSRYFGLRLGLEY